MLNNSCCTACHCDPCFSKQG